MIVAHSAVFQLLLHYFQICFHLLGLFFLGNVPDIVDELLFARFLVNGGDSDTVVPPHFAAVIVYPIEKTERACFKGVGNAFDIYVGNKFIPVLLADISSAYLPGKYVKMFGNTICRPVGVMLDYL